MDLLKARTPLPPGFRFHPTDVELVRFYLKRKVTGKKQPFKVISVLDIYKYPPWDLPSKSCLKSGDLKWYFFCPRGKKYASGARMNRATGFGFWKATGKDRPVRYNNKVVGQIKTLIFHRGCAPRGERTNWVMHEYRLEDEDLASINVDQDAFVLCMVFEKEGPGPRNGAQYGAPFKEEDWDDYGDESDGHSSEAGPSADLSSPVLMLPKKDQNYSAAPLMPSAPDNCTGSLSKSYVSEMAPPSADLSSPTPMLPEKEQNHSAALLMPSAPDNCTGSLSESYVSEMAPPFIQVIPLDLINEDAGTEASLVLADGDDVGSMLATFQEEFPTNPNGIGEAEVQIVANPDAANAPLVEGNDIFEDLGDLGDYFGLHRAGHAANGFTEWVELKDLDNPLHSAAVAEDRDTEQNQAFQLPSGDDGTDYTGQLLFPSVPFGADQNFRPPF